MIATKKPSTFKGDFKPTWCPGCGNFAVLAGLDRALVALELHSEEVVICSGIGSTACMDELWLWRPGSRLPAPS